MKIEPFRWYESYWRWQTITRWVDTSHSMSKGGGVPRIPLCRLCRHPWVGTYDERAIEIMMKGADLTPLVKEVVAATGIRKEVVWRHFSEHVAVDEVKLSSSPPPRILLLTPRGPIDTSIIISIERSASVALQRVMERVRWRELPSKLADVRSGKVRELANRAFIYLDSVLEYNYYRRGDGH